MSILLIFNNPRLWQFDLPGVEVVAAVDYLINPEYSSRKGLKVFNLCRSYRYQSTGYYVSLLAAARSHRAFPSISTIQEMKSPSVVQIMTEDLDELIQGSLRPIQSAAFDLSVYFGKNPAKKYDKLSAQLFRLFPVPLLRAQFRRKGRRWRLQTIQMISANAIPEVHRAYVTDFARDYFSSRIRLAPRKRTTAYDLAILVNEQEKQPPSDGKAIRKFVRAAEKQGFGVELIGKYDSHRLAEFDALFIRETTSVNHHTFRISQRAAAEGLVVIDDPDSILKCTNKVYLAELLSRCRIPTPKTVICNAHILKAKPEPLSFPMILKQPDSSFSQGVIKVDTPDDLARSAELLLARSELIIAQEFMPTEFDWRIGVLDGKPLYACKYYMAESHWQIFNWEKRGRARYGGWETVDVENAPPKVLKLAVRVARLIGEGLYGVDIKCVNNAVYVIEVNDNPTVETGVEDQRLGDLLYDRIIEFFLTRLHRGKLERR